MGELRNKVLYVRMREREKEALRAYAEERDIPISQLAREIISRWLRYQEEKGLHRAEKGDTI
ncbi:MAG: hypothetical protein ACUVS1_09985 [Actinomycetota bacterium]